MDRIWLLGVACRVRLGVPEAERRRPQMIRLDVGLELPTAAAARSDDFKATADYVAIERRVRACAEGRPRRLLERLAEDVAAAALACDRRVRAVTVRARKRPAVMPRTSEVVVEIRRLRRVASTGGGSSRDG